MTGALRGRGKDGRIGGMKPTEIPSRAIRMPYRVPYADTDMMGYVYYGNYLTLFERSRNELMRATGYTYAEMEKEGGALLPVVEEARGVRVRIRCVVLRDGEELAEGYTVHVCVDAATRRPIRVPPYLLAFASPDGAGPRPNSP